MAHSASPCKNHLTAEEEAETLEAEVARLRQQVCEQDGHIQLLEGEVGRGESRILDLERQIITWREKYDRLYDSHKRVQRVNQNLEDKLLQMADKCTQDKSQLARDVQTLSVRLAETNHSMGSLHRENERYKNDMNLAIQLLQCKPENFVSQKFDNLPAETQAKVSTYIMSKAKLNQESPTALSAKLSPSISDTINHEEFEFNISASLMAKILEESVQNSVSKHCDTCTCLKKSVNPFSYGETHYTVSTQTQLRQDNFCTKCSSEINVIPNTTCSAPPSPTINNDANSIIMPIPLTDIQPASPASKGNNVESIADKVKSITKPVEETTKLISLKHSEIMEKIGENLDEMNLKKQFQIPSMEPITGHHRLCDRTKPVHSLSKAATEYFYGKSEEENVAIEKEICKPIAVSPKLVSTIQMADDLDSTFAQLDTPSNLLDCKINYPSKTKADLNFVENSNSFRNNSISSNEAESKTSSGRSWKNGSHNSSNAKVHIGPGPRFCSLRMQAGSKNILLDNAQPNIAPVLYTRQSRNLDNSSSPIGVLCDDDVTTSVKKDNSQQFYGPSFVENINVKNVFSNNFSTDGIPILDLPNEELPLNKPIDVCEKPESGYKSNESAEIIDKLLFGVDPTNPVSSDKVSISIIENTPETRKSVDLSKECCLPESEINKKEVNILQKVEEKEKLDPLQRERRTSIHNMKVFNFDQYEKNLKSVPLSKITKENKILKPHFNNYGNAKIPGTARQVINDIAKETTQINTNDSIPVVQKNQTSKKLVRNIANQTVPENLPAENSKEWKKETSTEKSSSSLSSDDSAAVLQKQQLIRVAQWVQQNLDMEHQGDAATQQSVEELHHVRNDFPRPAKVEHRPRKGSHHHQHHPQHHPHQHPSKHTPARVSEAPQPLSNSETQEQAQVKVSMVMSQWECPSGQYSAAPSNITTRSYSKEELARMEYNVKQFLLNGSRWNTDSQYSGRDRRTSSKTETDL